MSILLNILVFLCTVFLLILVHEFGHFWVAKQLGFKIERFSIGFGKPLWHHRSKRGVEYVIAPILLGGYVKFQDESYESQAVWRRMLVMLAGVTANVLLAIFIFWLIFTIGIRSPKPIIGQVIPNSIAHNAGLQAGEEIKSINGNKIYDWQGVALAVLSRIGDQNFIVINGRNLKLSNWKISDTSPDPVLSLGIKPYRPFIPAVINKIARNSPAVRIGLRPKDRILMVNGREMHNWYDVIEYIQKHPKGQLAFIIEREHKRIQLIGRAGSRSGRWRKKIGYLGIISARTKWPPGKLHERRYSIVKAIVPALQQTWSILHFNLVVITKIASGKISLRLLGGPVTIFTATEEAFQLGIAVYLEFLALLSIMLAVINILPIPVLDGGNFVMLLVEAIIRRPIPEKVQLITIRVGMLFLLTIIFIAVGNDLMRLFF